MFVFTTRRKNLRRLSRITRNQSSIKASLLMDRNAQARRKAYCVDARSEQVEYFNVSGKK